MSDLRIEAPASDLEALRQSIYQGLGADANIQEITAIVAGELREPVLTAITMKVTPNNREALTQRLVRWRDERRNLEAVRVEVSGKVIERPTPKQLMSLLRRVEK